MTKPWRSVLGELFHLRAQLLVYIVVLLCVGVGCSREAKRDRHLKRANSYYESREYQKAAIEYLNALRLDPENPFCVSGLAKVYYEQGQLDRAFPLLLRARELDPKDVEVKIKLCRIYRNEHHMPKARELAGDILGKEPANEEALLILAETAVTAEETADVEQRVQQLRSQGGDRAVFHLVAGMGSVRQKDLKKAELAFKNAVSVDPKSPFACRALGTIYLLQGKVDEAGQEYEKEIKLAPQDLFARLRFAEFKIRTGSLEDAKGILQGITKEIPDFVPAWSYLATLALEEKRYDNCASLVTRVLSQRPEDFRALLVQAKLSLARTNVAQAIDEFKKLRTFYERIPQTHFELARAYLATNDVGNALTSLDQAVSLNPNFTEALFLKGQLNLKKGDYASAVTVFGQIARQNPQMLAAQLFLADAHLARGTPDEALAIYGRLSRSFPTNSELPYWMGLVYRQQKKDKEAEQAFAKALQLNPDNLAAVNQVLEMKIQQKDFQSARMLVDGIITRAPRIAEAWLMQANLYSAQGDATGAETALLKTIELNTNALAAYGALAKLYLDSNRGVQALSKLDEILARAPNNIPALMQKALIHERMSNYAKAAESYEKILTVAPQFGHCINNLAYLYSEHLGKLDRAYDLATKAHELLPDNPGITDTLGWILYKRGEYDRSVGPLSEAAAKLPRSAEIQFHLGMAHYMQGAEKEAKDFLRRALDLSKDFAGADEARQRLAMLEGDSNASDPQALAKLQKLLEKQPNDPIVLTRLAEVQAHNGAWDKARVLYEQVLKLNPQSVQAIMKLASLYAEKLNNPGRALELAKQGRNLAPNDAQVGHTFGRVAFQSGDHQSAVAVLQEMVRKQPPRSDLLYDFAWALYSVGRVTEAQEKMRQALKLNAPFPKAEQAKQFLSMTELAANLAAAEQAVAAVQTLLKSEPGYVPALMVLGALQTQQGSTKVARQTYEGILARYPHFSPALKALVVLPGGSGNDLQDYEFANKARKAFPDDAQVSKALGRAMYKRGDYAAANALLQQSLRALSDDAEAHYYLGMSSYKLGRQQQARLDLQRASELGLEGDLAIEATRILLEAK